ncbi:MAG: PQQ-binding-like beta-propeller repeat protein [Bryobacteraceae bacterium]
MRLLIALAALPLCSVNLFAANWPSWRGPAGNGVSTETSLPDKWSPTENIAWKLDLPSRSGATPVIWGDLVFLNVADGDTLELWAVNKSNGSVRWKKPIAPGNFKINKQNMSSPSPVTDGKTVWVMTGLGILKAFDFDGKELWMRDIQKDYGKFGLNWGYASSPLLHKGALFVPVLHGMKTDDPSYLLKVDAKTGKTIWRQERPTTAQRESPDSYVTPQLLRNGDSEEIVLNGGDCVTGHDAATGKELWRVEGLNPDNDPFYRIIASSLVHDGIVYAPTRVKPFLAIKAGGRGDVSKSHVLWRFANGPDVPTPVTDGKYLYLPNDRGIVWCLDAKSGAEVYSGQRIRGGIYSSSPVLADGKVYITNEEGTTTVFRAGPKLEVIAENAMGEYTLSSIAVSDGRLFLRTEKALYCVGKR